MHNKSSQRPFLERLGKDLRKYSGAYLLVIPVVLYYLIFCYKPIYGIIIAFKDFRPGKGILGSEWVGLKHFIDFFGSYYFLRTLKNTLVISISSLLVGFTIPIILALLLNEVKNQKFKRITQTISYMPHFISLVVICGIVRIFTGSTGVVTTFLSYFGMEPLNLLSQPQFYRTIYIASSVWESIGWESIIYMATLSSTDVSLYEAADLDGANRVQKIWHINLPVLIPIIAVQLIMRIGRIMSEGPDKTILLYSPVTYETSDIIASYVYRSGLEQFNYSSSAAIGLFNALINMGLVVFANWFSRTYADESLW